MFSHNEHLIDEIKEISKGTPEDRLLRIELGQQEIKKRLDRIERKLSREDDE